MSEQTKQQAIGYMTQALFEAGATADHLKAFFLHANETLATNGLFDNYNTRDYLENYILNANVFSYLQDDSGGAINHKKAEFIKNAKSALYWQHDSKTVEQAGDYFNAWLIVFNLYRRIDRAEFSEYWEWGAKNEYR